MHPGHFVLVVCAEKGGVRSHLGQTLFLECRSGNEQITYSFWSRNEKVTYSFWSRNEKFTYSFWSVGVEDVTRSREFLPISLLQPISCTELNRSIVIVTGQSIS